VGQNVYDSGRDLSTEEGEVERRRKSGNLGLCRAGPRKKAGGAGLIIVINVLTIIRNTLTQCCSADRYDNHDY
jgi:hypothetical protein